MTTKDKAPEQGNEEVTDLSTIGEFTGTLARPKSLDKNDLSGTEGIGPDDIRLPRLSIAQGLSKQMTPGDPLYIQGLTLFDMFNDMSNAIYGKGPITFVTIKREVKRIQFRPRSEGSGVIDPNVPKGDERLKWTKSNPDLDRPDTPPVATEIEEFVVMLLRPNQQPEFIVFGIALKNKWNRFAAQKLVTTIGMRAAPIYANLFSVDTSNPGKNDKGTFGVPTIKDLGFIPKDTPKGAAVFEHAKKFHELLKVKNIVTSEENVDDLIDDSMAANPEGSGPVGSASDM